MQCVNQDEFVYLLSMLIAFTINYITYIFINTLELKIDIGATKQNYIETKIKIINTLLICNTLFEATVICKNDF